MAVMRANGCFEAHLRHCAATERSGTTLTGGVKVSLTVLRGNSESGYVGYRQPGARNIVLAVVIRAASGRAILMRQASGYAAREPLMRHERMFKPARSSSAAAVFACPIDGLHARIERKLHGFHNRRNEFASCMRDSMRHSK